MRTIKVSLAIAALLLAACDRPTAPPEADSIPSDLQLIRVLEGDQPIEGAEVVAEGQTIRSTNELGSTFVRLPASILVTKTGYAPTARMELKAPSTMEAKEIRLKRTS